MKILTEWNLIVIIGFAAILAETVMANNMITTIGSSAIPQLGAVAGWTIIILCTGVVPLLYFKSHQQQMEESACPAP